MNTTPTGAITASILMLLMTRLLFQATLARYQSRKAHRRYKADIPFWNRWLLLSAPDYVQDKYIKLERKVIKAKATIRAIRAMNLLLHLLLAAEVLAILLNPAWSSAAFTVWFTLWGACLLLDIVIQWCNHPNAERARHGRKPPNW